MVSLNKNNNIEDIIVNFIKTKGIILYGGLAIDRLVKNASDDADGLYDFSMTIPDYDVFSHEPTADAEELAAEIPYEFIKIGSGMTGKTRKIWVNFVKTAVIDITKMGTKIQYTPSKYLTIYPDSIDVNGIKCCDPQYMKIDQYKNICCNLFTDVHRLRKAYKKIQLLEKYFPISASPSQSLEFSVSKIPLIIGEEEHIYAGDNTFKYYYTDIPIEGTPQEIILSNELSQGYIPPEGIRYTLAGVQTILLPINNETFYEFDASRRIVTRAGLLYIYYYLRYFNQTSMYDDRIRILLGDEKTFAPYIEETDVNIFIPKTQKFENPIRWEKTIYINKKLGGADTDIINASIDDLFDS